MPRLCIGVSLLCFFISSALAQIPTSDPQAITLATQSLTALTGGTSLSDVVLTASAYWFAGSDSETGTPNLKARGSDDSRIDLNLNGGQRSLIRNSLAGTPQGAWVGGTFSRPLAQHNCWTDANWFFPHFSLMTALRQQIVFTYVGREIRNGLTVEHLRSYRYLGGKPGIVSTFARLSTMDYFLDSVSLLPLAIAFNEHPDNDMNLDAQIEIRFAAYQTFNGIQLPSRVQRLVNDGLQLDLTITSATFNNGLQDSDFQIQ